MKKIETRTHLATRHLFDVMIDSKRLCFEAVEEDEHGNKILHKSWTINMSSAMGEESEYYLLTEEEYQQYKDRCGYSGKKKKKKKK
jgi:hypothetical protein